MSRLVRCVLLLAARGLAAPLAASAAVHRKKLTAGERYVIVEALDDDLIHVEMSAVGAALLLESRCTRHP